MNKLLNKEIKLVKKLIPSEIITGHQVSNLYPIATSFKYLGTNFQLNMHDKAVKENCLSKFRCKMTKLANFTNH